MGQGFCIIWTDILLKDFSYDYMLSALDKHLVTVHCFVFNKVIIKNLRCLISLLFMRYLNSFMRYLNGSGERGTKAAFTQSPISRAISHDIDAVNGLHINRAKYSRRNIAGVILIHCQKWLKPTLQSMCQLDDITRETQSGNHLATSHLKREHSGDNWRPTPCCGVNIHCCVTSDVNVVIVQNESACSPVSY